MYIGFSSIESKGTVGSWWRYVCGVSIGPEKNPITININLEMQSTLHDRNKKLQNRQNRAKK